jgi:hypothetical protein
MEDMKEEEYSKWFEWKLLIMKTNRLGDTDKLCGSNIKMISLSCRIRRYVICKLMQRFQRNVKIQGPAEKPEDF